MELLLLVVIAINCLFGIIIILMIMRSNNNKGASRDQIQSLLAQSSQLQMQQTHQVETNLVERFIKLEQATSKDLFVFKENITKELNTDFNRLNEQLERRLLAINEKVEQRLDKGFEKTSQTFQNVIERLGKIDEAQKKIDALSSNIISLQDILTDKKTRGTFGEVQLAHIFDTVFGTNDQIYQLQYRLKNGTQTDLMLFAPDPLGSIAIDSKFPLENYRRLTDRSLSELEAASASKLFVSDVKKHIDAIADKYICPPETADQAIMFIPAEAIFAEIHAYHSSLIDYASKRNVWIASPTTLMALLSTLQVVLRNMERDKYAQVIREELERLGLEFARYKDRWDKLSRSIDTVSKTVKEVHTTTNKITRRFDEISNAKFIEAAESNPDLLLSDRLSDSMVTEYNWDEDEDVEDDE